LNKILTIIGPTAVGKTKLAIDIAKNLNAEVIGLDSRQVYKSMTIGTAQPSKKEKQGVKHHLIGIRDPWVNISAGEYARMVIEKINEINNRGSVPIICGGAGLYYRALTQGIFAESYTDLQLREELELRYKKDSILLLKQLQDIDPEYAKIVHINNKKRLIRAMEIFELTGLPPTEHFNKQKKNNFKLLDLYTIYLSLRKDTYQKKIDLRTNQMFDAGWVSEVKELLHLQKDKNTKIPALNSIGYQEIIRYIKGGLSKDKLIESVIIKTRQYAKKQMKWFKKEDIDLLIDLTNLNEIDFHKYICDIYNNF
jgi:tRNA dimethylallyltransferase